MPKSPDAFRTIGEVSDWLDTPNHVIRFWESRFEELDPVQKQGGRRYFRPDDLLFMGGLKKLLHDDGLTIKSVQAMIKDQGIDAVTSLSQPLPDTDPLEDSEPLVEELDTTEISAAPEQKPLMLMSPGEVFEPNHKWHLKLEPGTDPTIYQAALDKLLELRKKLATKIAD